jgi:colanic acid/amylovoran biosynthesis glycosyltransferase
MLLYVITDHPSVSETFVVTEASAVRAAGVSVAGYALRRGRARRPAAPLDLACAPPSLRRLVLEVARSLFRFCQDLWFDKGGRISPREAVRLLLAEAHAAHAWRHVRTRGITHVHAHFLGRQADVALALSRRLGCKCTVTAHAADAYAPSEPALFQRRLRNVSGIACASHSVKRAVLSNARGRAPLTHVIRCGVDLSVIRETRGRTDAGARHVVTIARLVATKGHWTIFHAACEMMARDHALRWTVIGDGELDRALRKDPRYRAAYPRLMLTGPLDHEVALQHLAGASAFVLPCEPDARSDSDGIPVALMEAMALQVPVITTAVGGIPELVSDRVTGFIVPPRDATSLVRVLSAVLYATDDDDLTSIRSAGLAKVMRDFSAPREAAKLIQFIREATGQDVA